MGTELRLEVSDEQAMRRLGEHIASVLGPGDLVYLVGVLGAGKTTLVQGIARGLGVTGRVTSPTFTLVNVYEGRVPVYHCDLYRLEEGELVHLGLEDLVEGDGVVLVEWPERGLASLGEATLVVELEVVEGDYDLPRRVRIWAPQAGQEGRVEELKTRVGAGN
ncbi:MAG: tRNA (adenosine(37)-N6)-threonylcarbamoyltransferase complex ATPase subunit type 1 TsaE [Syntrophomonadaceae bacterium]|jgi:tRNA threonylcarbamoyladenosine biosynthesis protein TsaE|nr:tRNA (adenosine(37)-N6)-threonylcarbamoyltransferase complex ATPase subunit type 1 TsaE [Syntrophomonadaceae bacterium]MDH7497184.1 tRNA (adenosine(37)-N6)-threonylcarbamoyltransferase complex ATPase subunit type 1 TsaE [Syntrophomonadaceae bacterium]